MGLRNQTAFVNNGLLKCPDGSFSNLALILSDQCPWSFEIRNNGELIETVQGSILTQLQCIERTTMTIRQETVSRNGLENRRIHSLAFEEVVLNAASHRSYCNHEPTVIDLQETGLSVISPGGLVRVGNGHDGRTRNPRLTETLHSLGFNNSMVRGFQGVVQCYRNS